MYSSFPSPTVPGLWDDLYSVRNKTPQRWSTHQRLWYVHVANTRGSSHHVRRLPILLHILLMLLLDFLLLLLQWLRMSLRWGTTLSFTASTSTLTRWATLRHLRFMFYLTKRECTSAQVTTFVDHIIMPHMYDSSFLVWLNVLDNHLVTTTITVIWYIHRANIVP